MLCYFMLGIKTVFICLIFFIVLLSKMQRSSKVLSSHKHLDKKHQIVKILFINIYLYKRAIELISNKFQKSEIQGLEDFLRIRCPS